MSELSVAPANWRNIGGDSAAASSYLDMVANQIDEVRARVTNRLELFHGAQVLEVGCGNGREAERLATLVGPNGRVTATDVSGQLIELAQRRTESLGLPLEFRTADVHALPFADGGFDAARVERVLQHVADPARAVRELVRVIRSGGRICAFEPDWETMIIAAGDGSVQRAIKRYKADVRIANGVMGRELLPLFLSAGCREVSVEPVVSSTTNLPLADAVFGISDCLRGAVAQQWVSQEEASSWWEAAETCALDGGFQAFVVGMIVSGRAP
jgi:2-polyprenyl-3-methyl-5-hydroxy-6-metoxy-1,4-benzoquinol methylase